VVANAQLAVARVRVAEAWAELERARACAAVRAGRVTGDEGMDGGGEAIASGDDPCEALVSHLRALLQP
jgi:hypothetical protein